MEFDTFKNDYREQLERSVSLVGQDADFFSQVKSEILVKIAEKNFKDLTTLKVLDIGCGIGLTDRFLVGKFGYLAGVDISPGVIDMARQSIQQVEYLAYDGNVLPYPDGHFDIAFTICVLHHVSPNHRERFISEMKRVTKKNGLNVIFEHNPFNPLTLYVVNRCAFDDDAILLKPQEARQLLTHANLEVIEQSYYLFFPWRGKVFKFFDKHLRALPLGAQYVTVGRICQI